MPRYVILRHHMPALAARASHWDLMVESNEGPLHAWAIEQPPDVPEIQRAERLADHRSIYLEYEGPLSNDRGRVERWDSGSCDVLTSADGHWQLHLQGDRLRGVVFLRAVIGTPGAWTYRYEAEGSAGD